MVVFLREKPVAGLLAARYDLSLEPGLNACLGMTTTCCVGEAVVIVLGGERVGAIIVWRCCVLFSGKGDIL